MIPRQVPAAHGGPLKQNATRAGWRPRRGRGHDVEGTEVLAEGGAYRKAAPAAPDPTCRLAPGPRT